MLYSNGRYYKLMIIFFFLILFFGSNVNAIDIDNSDINSTLRIIPENNISSHNDNFYFGIKINLSRYLQYKQLFERNTK